MPRYPGFLGGSNQQTARALDCERSVNLLFEPAQSKSATSSGALISTPGFQPWTPVSSVGDVGGRATRYANGRFFALIGAGFYEFDSNGTPIKRGAVAQDGNLGQIIFNGVVGGQLLIASGTNAYCFVLSSNAFSQVLTGTATQIAYSTGFFLAFNIKTGKVAESALNDGTTWNAGIFFQRSLLADPWQAMFTDGNGLVYLPGTESFEVWQNTGVGTQPFAPLSGLVGRYGIASSFAWAMAGALPYWLSQNEEGSGLLVRVTGGGVQSVSTYAVASAFSTYARTSTISDVEIFPYQDQGHTAIIVQCPSVPATWAYDIEGNGWSERGRWNAARGAFDLWSPRVHAKAFGKHLILDRTSGQVSQMDASFATEIDGTGIRRLRIAPAVFDDSRRIPHNQLALIMDRGVGLAAGQGADPQVMLRASDDGGTTWGNEHRAGFGRMGKYRGRVFWNRLGLSDNRAYEVSCSEPVPVRFVEALINPTDGELLRAA